MASFQPVISLNQLTIGPGSRLSARGKAQKHTVNGRAKAESHSLDLYHLKELWNHSLCVQRRQGAEKRAGSRDCKLNPPLLSEDKNHLPKQRVVQTTDQSTNGSDLLCVTQPPCQDNFSMVAWQPPFSQGRKKKKKKEQTSK